jgi:predicted nucleic acid-binding protein
LEKWGEEKFTVVVTTDVVDEYFEVLNRPKFGLKQETIDNILGFIYDSTAKRVVTLVKTEKI